MSEQITQDMIRALAKALGYEIKVEPTRRTIPVHSHNAGDWNREYCVEDGENREIIRGSNVTCIRAKEQDDE